MSNLYRDYRGDEYNKLREKYEPGYMQKKSVYESSSNDYLKDIERLLEPFLDFPTSILDWGGSSGMNTPFNYENNILDIFDISDVEVIEGTNKVNKEQIYGKVYGLICCMHTLEHTPYPQDVLLEIKKHMDNKSILYIELPFETLMTKNKFERPIKRHWHEHINFYSKKSIINLCAAVGLRVIEFKVSDISTAASAQNVMQVACMLEK